VDVLGGEVVFKQIIFIYINFELAVWPLFPRVGISLTLLVIAYRASKNFFGFMKVLMMV